MLKFIKKSLHSLIIVLGILIMVPVVLYSIIQIPEVQTLLVKRISGHFSAQLRSTIEVGRIEFKFFNRFTAENILIRDQEQDTMIYVRSFSAGIRSLGLGNGKIKLGKVEILRPKLMLRSDSTGILNLARYLNLIRSADTTKTNGRTNLTISELDLNNALFSMADTSGNRELKGFNFRNFQLTDINAIAEDITIINDSIRFGIYNLGFREAGGFRLKKLNCQAEINSGNIFVTSAFINCDSSIIDIQKLGISYDSAATERNIAKNARIELQLRKSLINSSDLAFFLPAVRGTNESLLISGRIFGTVPELRGRDINMSYGYYTKIDCDFDISGLPDFDNAYMYLGINKLVTKSSDLESIPLGNKKKIDLPPVLNKMGIINFEGSFTGFLTDFVTYGELRSDIGRLRTDVSLRPEGEGMYRIRGLLKGSGIDLGTISENSEKFGRISMSANVDGEASQKGKFSVNLTGNIDSAEINNYVYRNISLNGKFNDRAWDGSIKIQDKNIKLDFLGSFNLEKELPEFDFTVNLNEARLFNLNFDKRDSTSSLSLLMTSNFKGNNLDNLDGEIRLLNSNIVKFGKSLEMYDFLFKTYNDRKVKVLSLKTDFIDAELKGKYNFSTLGYLLESTLSGLMPSQFKMPPLKFDPRTNNFRFNINFKNTDKINDLFRTGFQIAEKSSVIGNVTGDSLINISARASSLLIKNNLFSDFAFDARAEKKSLSATLKGSSLALMNQTDLKDFFINLDTRPDNFIFKLGWDNKEDELNKGDFIASGSFIPAPGKKQKALLSVIIDSSDVFIRNNRWKISKSEITVDTSSVRINKFRIGNNKNYYLVDGALSVNPHDILNISFHGIDISPLNYIGARNKVNDPERLQTDFMGTLNGNIRLTDVYKDLLLEGDLKVDDFSLLGSLLGTVSVKSAYDAASQIVRITLDDKLAEQQVLGATGSYDPVMKKLSVTAAASKLPIGVMNRLLRTFASGINGTVSGKMNFSAGPSGLLLTGSVLPQNSSIKIDYLQTKYQIIDSINFEKSAIKFNNVRINDDKGNTGVLAGVIKHNGLKNFTPDISITMNNTPCQILNTKSKDNEYFYGTAYATGVTTIRSEQNTLIFDISARSGKNTRFFVPLTGGLSVSDYSFVTFSGKDGLNGQKNSGLSDIGAPPASKKTGMEVNVDLEVTPDAETQLIFDSKVGDVMKGRGRGDLNVSYDRNGNFRMYGDYIIESGDYLFTLQNILNKSFSVENGGKIIFNGDLDNAEIEVKAIYKVKAALSDLLGDPRFSERIPIECQLNLTGKLFNPVVGFNVYLPVADEETRTYVRNALSTEEELSRQFLYLLIMNRFYTDPALVSAAPITASTGTSAMRVTTTEMLSNQFSNWLSQLSNDFDVNFVYRPGSGNKDINPQEVQVALSTQLLNNKVKINGNFDLRGTTSSADNTNQLTGDFDAEYSITDKIKFKVFNRFNNPYSGKGAGVPYTQGIGIFYMQEFSKFSDLFKKPAKQDSAKLKGPLILKKK